MKKPRVAIYYSNTYGRNDGPPLYYFEALKRLGFDTTHLLAEGDTRTFGTFDLHFWVDWGEDGLIPLGWTEWMPPKDGGKTIYVASDTHLDNGYRIKKATQFDYAFFNQDKAISEFMNLRKQGELYQLPFWLPHAAEPLAYPHTVQAKKYDVCFIGHLSDEDNVHNMSRVEVLDRVFKAYPNFYFGTRDPQKPGVNMFEDASRRFNQSRVVLNHCVRDDGLNMRFFEVLISGSFLLTSRTPDAEALGFIEGKHFAAYESYPELLQKIEYYLEHEDEREKIAQTGHALAREHHTYTDRIKTIMEVVGFRYNPPGESVQSKHGTGKKGRRRLHTGRGTRGTNR